ncbi:MAG: helix-turn-helix domain-containing protein [Kiritimatiellia bacterium]|jgi:transcriptional regulator with XRE-family HTH domain|uniref:helix-turn-helix domain-containing protein n=1 Tax=Atribacter sp. TaxID=2847780 RepID=UPI003D965A82
MKTIHSAEYRVLLGWLREQRQSRKLTMRTVAERLDVPHSWVGKVETGERRLDVCEYLALCQAIGCDYKKGMNLLAKSTLPHSRVDNGKKQV